jgi:hypothetical protein
VRIDIRRLRKFVHNLPSVFRGYNIYVDTEKLRLMDFVLGTLFPSAHSLADLGGVWKVNGAYALYATKKFRLERGVLVDTDISPEVMKLKSTGIPLQVIKGDFTQEAVMRELGAVDVVLFFDVLLHQSNPSWSEVLTAYAKQATCIVIYNQQYIQSEHSIRLTSLPFEEYCRIAPRGRTEVYRHIYAHADEIHPSYGKPWRDIHNIFQWGITDADLRAHMKDLGYHELSYRNYGQFSDLPAFENHSFVFKRG